MPNYRAIPSTVQRELERQESAEFYLVFLTIEHDNLDVPIRVVSDTKNFILDGNTYQGFHFGIRILSDTENMPFAQLTIQNADERIGDVLLAATSPARLQIDVIAGSEFDLTVEPRTPIGTPEIFYQAKKLYLRDVEGDILYITGRIASFDYSQELYPGMRATQDRFPGLFR